MASSSARATLAHSAISSNAIPDTKRRAIGAAKENSGAAGERIGVGRGGGSGGANRFKLYPAAHGRDLGDDRDRDFSRRLAAYAQPDRPVQPRNFLGGQVEIGETFAAFLVIEPGAE